MMTRDANTMAKVSRDDAVGATNSAGSRRNVRFDRLKRQLQANLARRKAADGSPVLREALNRAPETGGTSKTSLPES
jgi:hypothetical protein